MFSYRCLLLIAVAALGLGGCTVGPDYVRPDADVNPAWLESTPALQDEPTEVREWWTAFDDPVLTSLVHEAREDLTLGAGLTWLYQGSVPFKETLGVAGKYRNVSITFLSFYARWH